MTRTALRACTSAIVAVAVAACSGPGAGCGGEVQPIPPSTIAVTGSSTQTVEFTSWQCPGYNADSSDVTNVTVRPDGGGSLEIFAGPLGTGANTTIRLETDAADRLWVLEGDGPWRIETDGPGTVKVWACTEDERCALYRFEVAAPAG